MIFVENLTKTYSTTRGPVAALQDINLEISAGEIFGIAGYSGAGTPDFPADCSTRETYQDGTLDWEKNV